MVYSEECLFDKENNYLRFFINLPISFLIFLLDFCFTGHLSRNFCRELLSFLFTIVTFFSSFINGWSTWKQFLSSKWIFLCFWRFIISFDFLVFCKSFFISILVFKTILHLTNLSYPPVFNLLKMLQFWTWVFLFVMM